MASRLDSTHVEDSTTRYWHPGIPALSFVGLVALLNAALNGFLAGIRPALPPLLQFEYAVAVGLAPPGAGVLAVGTGVLVVWSLALFVRSVGRDTGRELEPVSVDETLLRFGRATGVVVAGMLATVIGLALLVLPGLVVLVYLPFVFTAVVLDGRTVVGAIAASHARIATRPVAVAVTSLATVFALLGVGLIGMVSTLFPPAAEFALGGITSALVVLAGIYVLTGLYQRSSPQPSSTHGQL